MNAGLRKFVMNTSLSLYEKYPDILILIPLILSAFAHSVMMGYYFIQDDFAYFYQIENVGFWNFLITPWGGHAMIIRNLFFYIMFKIFGMNAPCYFIFMNAIHLVNTALIFMTIREFTQSRAQAVFWSSIWGIAPIQQGSLRWFSSLGHVIIATMVLLILYDIGRIKNAGLKPTGAILIRWILLLIFASISWGIGLSIAMTFSAVAWLLLYGVERRRWIAGALVSLVVIVPCVYFCAMLLHQRETGVQQAASISIEWGNPSFWILQAKVLAGMLSYSLSSILLGPYIFLCRNSAPGYVVPVSYFIMLLVIVFGIPAYHRSPANDRHQMTAFGLLTCVICGTFALGRAWMFHNAGFSNSVIVQTPRYYYLSTMYCAMLLSLCCSAYAYGIKMKPRIAYTAAAIILIVLFVPSRWAANLVEMDHGRANKLEFNRVVSGLQKEIDTMSRNDVLYIKNEKTRSIWIFAPREDFPGIAAIYITAFPDRDIRGRKILFVEEDARLVEKVRKSGDSRISRILVTSEEAGNNPVVAISF